MLKRIHYIFSIAIHHIVFVAQTCKIQLLENIQAVVHGKGGTQAQDKYYNVSILWKAHPE